MLEITQKLNNFLHILFYNKLNTFLLMVTLVMNKWLQILPFPPPPKKTPLNNKNNITQHDHPSPHIRLNDECHVCWPLSLIRIFVSILQQPHILTHLCRRQPLKILFISNDCGRSLCEAFDWLFICDDPSDIRDLRVNVEMDMP